MVMMYKLNAGGLTVSVGVTEHESVCAGGMTHCECCCQFTYNYSWAYGKAGNVMEMETLARQCLITGRDYWTYPYYLF